MQDKQNPAIIITTRVPVDASCKTRLSPLLDARERCLLQRAMIEDELEAIRQTGLPCLAFFTPAEEEGAMLDIAGDCTAILPQTGAGLGQMMRNAFEHAFAEGYSPCILVGSDVPQLSEDDFRQAMGALEGNDVVLGPTEDGGYCLIGMNGLVEAAFDVQAYGTRSVLDETVRALEAGGCRVALTQTHRDVDTPEDLKALTRKEDAAHLKSSQLARKLLEGKPEPTISIVIPAYNEESTLGTLLPQLKPLRDRCQIIFVDGGSEDASRRIIEDAGYPCLSGCGRGNQLNTGARKATGDALFFLHCDSVLPPDPLGQIREVLGSERAGFFGVRFDSEDWVMGVCGRQSNRRAKYRQIPFGDQGIFIFRDLFWEMGGFPEIPLMEDYQFSMGVRERGIRFGQTRDPIITSARRYGKGFFHQLKVMYQMHELRFRYRHGCSPEKLKERYKKVK